MFLLMQTNLVWLIFEQWPTLPSPLMSKCKIHLSPFSYSKQKSLCKDILHTECIFVGIFTGSSMMLRLENFYFSRFQLYSAHNKNVCGLPRVKTFLCSFQKNLSQTVSMAHPQEDVVMWKNLRAETAIDQKSICKNFENWLIVWVFQTKVPK